MEDSELDFQTHLERSKVYAYDKQKWHDEASKQYSLFLSDALLKFHATIAFVSNELENRDAMYFMLFGAARCLQMIWHPYRTIIFTVPPDGWIHFQATNNSTSRATSI
jgi:hypothetical protein